MFISNLEKAAIERQRKQLETMEPKKVITIAKLLGLLQKDGTIAPRYAEHLSAPEA
jgi:hypothetical protein